MPLRVIKYLKYVKIWFSGNFIYKYTLYRRVELKQTMHQYVDFGSFSRMVDDSLSWKISCLFIIRDIIYIWP